MHYNAWKGRINGRDYFPLIMGHQRDNASTSSSKDVDILAIEEHGTRPMTVEFYYKFSYQGSKGTRLLGVIVYYVPRNTSVGCYCILSTKEHVCWVLLYIKNQ